MKKNNTNIFIVILYCLIFQDLIKNFIPIFQYFDEVLALTLILVFKIKGWKNNFKYKYNLKNIIIILLILGLSLIGLLSNIIYEYQSTKYVITDLLLVNKFFMVYFLSKMCFSTKTYDGRKILFRHVQFMTYVLFILTILNYIFKIWPFYYRYGIMSNRLFYSYPTVLAATCITLLSLLYLSKGDKNVRKEILCLVLILFSTLRAKAIGAAVITILIVLLIKISHKKISNLKVIFLAIIAISICWNQISFYFIDIKNSARNQLLLKSFQIANDYFPLGTGFRNIWILCFWDKLFTNIFKIQYSRCVWNI